MNTNARDDNLKFYVIDEAEFVCYEIGHLKEIPTPRGNAEIAKIVRFDKAYIDRPNKKTRKRGYVTVQFEDGEEMVIPIAPNALIRTQVMYEAGLNDNQLDVIQQAIIHEGPAPHLAFKDGETAFEWAYKALHLDQL